MFEATHLCHRLWLLLSLPPEIVALRCSRARLVLYWETSSRKPLDLVHCDEAKSRLEARLYLIDVRGLRRGIPMRELIYRSRGVFQVSTSSPGSSDLLKVHLY